MRDKIEEFLNYLRVQKNCSGRTLSSYRSDLEQFVDTMQINSLDEITKAKIVGFLAHLTNQPEPAKPPTRNRKLTAIRSFCQFLCAEEYILRNPTFNIPYAKVEKRLPDVMTTVKTAEIIDSAEDNKRDKAALETFYGTGCRIGEIVKIKVTDIDFNSARATVIGKGDKQRIVPLSNAALVAIAEYLAERTVESDYLFPGRTPDRPISERAMYDVVRKYGDANGVHSNPHMFRHSIATHLLANGMDIRKIQELLGHENINTTTIYTQVVIDQMANEFHSAHPRG